MARNNEIPSPQDHIEIKNIQELQTEIGVQESQLTEEDFKAPLKVSREDLKKFREEISQTPEALKYESIKAFIQEKAYVLDKSEKARQTIMGDGTLQGVITASTSEVKEEIQKFSQETDPLKKLDGIAGMFDKIGNVWDKITLGISAFLWSKAPALAKLFGLDNPEAKIAEEARLTAEETTRQTMEDVREKSQNLNQKIDINTKFGYKNSAKIFFTLFKPSHETEKKHMIDSDLESVIIYDLLSTPEFSKMTYNELSSPEAQQKLLIILKTLDNRKEYNDEKKTLTHIQALLGSISGGNIEYTTGKWFWKNTHQETINKGPSFIQKMYEIKGTTPSGENPTMQQLFETMSFVKDFDFLTDPNGIDFNNVINSLSGGLNNVINSSSKGIADMGEVDFGEIKDHLPNKLKNIDNFKGVTIACMRSHDTRALENGFHLSDKYSDSVSNLAENDGINNFIFEELKTFGDAIYESIFQNKNFIGGINSIKKSDLTLADIYRIYMATGGETDPSKLNPIQKMNTTALILFGFSSAYGIGKKIGDILKVDGDTKITIPDDVQNVLMAIFKAAGAALKKAAKAAAKTFAGLAVSNPGVAVGLGIIILKFPFFTKRQDLIGLARGK